ncbi:MAG: hypothetical protein IKF64_05000 [Eubacterium sp.]|nr:hypothetical protein [Eubacterium sp.]
MKASDAIRKIMKDNDFTLVQISKTLNTSVRLVSDRLRMKNISLSKLSELLNAIDYKIVIIPKNTQVPDGGYEIE